MSKLGVGSPLDEGVAKQLEVRSTIFSKSNRDNNTLLILTANKPWIRLSSGVNVLTEDEKIAIEQEGKLVSAVGTSTLASKNILGDLKTTGGLGDKGKADPTYKLSETLGYRPQPGITSANIRSKGAYGTLRETTINFIVWTLEDLETMEQLYLRPGYSMLLEWGHSVYADENGELVKLPPTYGADFFSPQNTKDIEKAIDSLRENSSYNYDAVFGYVKNYNWTFRRDGGYDCSVTLASKGTLIESLKVDVSPLKWVDRKLLSINDDEAKEEQKSIFHYFFTKLKQDLKITTANAGRLDGFKDTGLISKNRLQEVQQSIFQGIFGGDGVSNYRTFNVFKELLDPISDFKIYRNQLKKDEKFSFYFWIPLRTFLELFNEYVGKGLGGDNRVEFYTGVQDGFVPNTNLPYQTSCKFVTTKRHFALDPLICILPENPTVSSTGRGSGNAIQAFPARFFGEITEGKNAPLLKGVTRGVGDDILNIYVNTDMLKGVLDGYVDSEKRELRDSLGMMKDILSKINDNLGGVNELDLHYEENTQLYYIIDRKNTPETEVGYPVLDLTGLRSTMQNVQLSSKLSNQVGSQVAIAAQGTNENYNENISELLKWNEGLVERHYIPELPSNDSASTVSTPTPQPGFWASLVKAVSTALTTLGLNVSTIGESKKKIEAKNESDEENFLGKLSSIYIKILDSKSYNNSSLNEMKSYFRTYMTKYVETQQIAEGKPEKGIIPIELSLTLLGVSGMTIAKAFKVNRGILPQRVTDRFGFIITGVDHEIGNQWTTTVKTQFYTLEKPSDRVINAKQETIPSNFITEAFDNQQTETSECSQDKQIVLTSGQNSTFTLADLSCNIINRSSRYSLPAQNIFHPVYGVVTRDTLVENLKSLANNILVPIKAKYPTMVVTSGYRFKGTPSQHEIGQAVDIQFTDLYGKDVSFQNRSITARANEIKNLLGSTGFDQFLLEFKTYGTKQPWLHISYKKESNRGDFRTFLNDKTFKSAAFILPPNL